MKQSDVCVVLFFYVLCLVFYVLIGDLPEEAQTYPMTIVGCLALLNTFFAFQHVKRFLTEGLLDDFPAIFSGFQTKQFFGAVLLCLGFVVLLPLAGFYVASLVFLVSCLLFLHVPKLHLLLTILVLAGLIYVVFTLFLKVPLPMGILFS
ncbi:MAG: tripartite tricarboxylate transporter TctB family protein [Desulfovibrio sp.]|nr:tripartite tricarboxylate transporter TctB family protein [Desulfovibrio sp.]